MPSVQKHPRGGLYFEDFPQARSLTIPLRRTVLEADNMWFSNLTLNPQPLHIDRDFCERETVWGQPLVNSFFTLGLMIGISVSDTTMGTTVGNLGMSEARFPHPLFRGDTVRVETQVMTSRPSASRPNDGIVEFEHRAYKQSGELVAICRRQALMLRRPRVGGVN